MNQDHKAIVDAITTRLKQQLDYYEKILELGSQEKVALESDDAQALMKVLNWKQKYLAKIDKLKDELFAYKEQWEPIRENVSDEIKNSLKVYTDKTEELLKAIIELEKDNIDMAQAHKDGISRKISTYKYGTKAVKSYLGTGMSPRKNIMDKKT